MKTDVVVPVYGSLNLVSQCIATLKPQDNIGTIIVVDDATPGSEMQDYIEAAGKGIQYIRLDENMGFVDAVNTGMKHVKTEYAVIVNSDTAPANQRTLSTLIMGMYDHGASVAGPKLLFMGGSKYGAGDTIQHAGIGFNPEGVPYHPFMHLHRHTKAANIAKKIHAVTGAVMAVKMDVWRSVRGFDTLFSPGVYEDVDFCLRAGGVWYIPHSVWYHWMHGSQTTGNNLFENEQEHLGLLMQRWNITCDEELFYGV